MTGSCWRLLACFSLLFLTPILSAPALLGQRAVAERSAILGPVSATLPDTLPDPLLLPRPPLPLPRLPPPSAPLPLPLPVGGPRRTPVLPVTVGLPQIVRAAGIIFSGQVTSVGRADSFLEGAEVHAASPSGQSAVATLVTFKVEHALRGATTGQSLTIREWAGLWTARERYRVGERVLLFLYSPSKLGLTSSVSGLMGRFAIDSQGKIVMNEQNLSVVAADPVIGGKNRVPYADFLHAIRRASGEE
jgi:hypothetical protein